MCRYANVPIRLSRYEAFHRHICISAHFLTWLFEKVWHLLRQSFFITAQFLVVKKLWSRYPFLSLLFTLLVIFSSCKKVNEATLLGDDLVPEVDNINTFDTLFETTTDNLLLADTMKLAYTDAVALGNITNDPEFGQTKASVYLQVSPATYGSYPFSVSKDSVTIDSVVLSLEYLSGYGEMNTPQTVRVYEVSQASTFNDTTSYPFNQADFETTGAELGSQSFTMSTLDDSVVIARADTVKVANQLRIHLDPALGERFRLYDTTGNTATGAYHNDTLFKNLFRGFAVKADEGPGNGLAYFNLSNSGQTALTIYYKAKKGGVATMEELSFTHARRLVDSAASVGGQANCIKRQLAGGWNTYINNGLSQDDALYIQSTPGSVGYITIPGLTSFDNKLIHRAELIVHRLPSTHDDAFIAPDQLFLDKIKTDNGKDSAFAFDEYLVPVTTSTGTVAYQYNYASAGGHLRTDDTYRFNVTATVQNILARDSANYQLRIYAPFKTAPFDPRLQPSVPRALSVLPYPAYGRVVLAGGNYADPAKRLRLRVIYSKL